MARTRNVLAQALGLPPEQRADLARQLIDSLDEGPFEDPELVAKAWDKEVARRLREVKSGKVKPVPWPVVKKDMDRVLRAVSSSKRRESAPAR